MAPTLRNNRDFGTSKYQLEEEITLFSTIAEDRNSIRAAARNRSNAIRQVLSRNYIKRLWSYRPSPSE